MKYQKLIKLEEKTQIRTFSTFQDYKMICRTNLKRDTIKQIKVEYDQNIARMQLGKIR